MHLNTSHVNVNLRVIDIILSPCLNLNTSHVNVNLNKRQLQDRNEEFKYISC